MSRSVIQVTCTTMVTFLASCNGEPLDLPHEQQWKSTYSAGECEALLQRQAVIERCGGGNIDKALESFSTDITQCLPFSPPTRMTGLWEIGFEHSEFYPDARELVDIGEKNSGIWLTANQSDMTPETIAAIRGGPDLVYRVDFVGRRSLCDFSYGHMGGSDNEVIVNRFLEITSIKKKTF